VPGFLCPGRVSWQDLENEIEKCRDSCALEGYPGRAWKVNMTNLEKKSGGLKPLPEGKLDNLYQKIILCIDEENMKAEKEKFIIEYQKFEKENYDLHNWKGVYE